VRTVLQTEQTRSGYAANTAHKQGLVLELTNNPELAANLAYQYCVSKRWNVRDGSDGNFQVEICPYKQCDNWHFYVVYTGPKGDSGLHMCQKCGSSGNLYSLQQKLGDGPIPGVYSAKEFGSKEKKIDALPDVDAAHAALLADADAMDYLLNERGISQETIEQHRLGLVEKHWFKSAGDVRAIVIPYLVGDQCIFVKYRTFSPAPRDFSAPKGWDVPLFNGEILKAGLKEIVFVEGEYDQMVMESHGFFNVVGVPGAGIQKAEWIKELDDIAPDNIYILLDNDKAGTTGAHELASRIGIDRCLKIVLPNLEYVDDFGVTKKCKDVTDFFVKCGGTVEQFEKIKADAKQFDVSGVASTGDTLQELKTFLQGKDSLMPTYCTPWPSLNQRVGFENGDVCDLIAEAKTGKSTVALNMLEFAVTTYNEPALFVCLEMTRVRLARKWVSHVTQTDDSIPKSEAEGKVRLTAMLAAVDKAAKIAANRTADLYFCYPQVDKPEDVYNLIRQCYRRYGVKWVVVDNLQLLCDMTLANQTGQMQNRTVLLSTISKSLMRLTKDLDIKMIRILQPHQIKEDNIIAARNTDGSSQISKDCDCHIMFHRNPVGDTKKSTFESAGVLETDAAMDSRMLCTVGLTRYSAGGSCTLEFVGGTSTVREYTAEASAAIPKRDPSLIRSTEVVKPLFKLPTAPRIATQPVAVAQESAKEITI
jgi:5S rRNA maturation endonuclease (ribonuclease M5)